MINPTTVFLLISVILLSAYYIAFKFNKERNYDYKYLNARHIIANKKHFSKIQIQKAQQFMDTHNDKKA